MNPNPNQRMIIIPMENFVRTSSGPGGPTTLFNRGPRLPEDKLERELALARGFAKALNEVAPDREWTDIEPGEDPPDVVGLENGTFFNLEIGEIRNPTRTRGNDHLGQFRDDLNTALPTLRPNLMDKAFVVDFVDPYQIPQPFPKKKKDRKRLVEAVIAGLKVADETGEKVSLPAPLTAVWRKGAPLQGDPLVPHPDDPKISFTAAAVNTGPDIVDAVVSVLATKKLTVSVDKGKNYLLLWIQTKEFSLQLPEVMRVIEVEIVKRFKDGTIPYHEIFLFDLCPPDGTRVCRYPIPKLNR